MKPKLLKISAFGPFKKETIIDFTYFKGKGLYLISGDTGSGKTSIFDAICYALYSSTSGSARSSLSLRSKYADDDTKTFVELLFSHQNKEYLIRRNPEHQIISKDKLKTVKSSVELVLDNGEVINRVKEVELRIKEIIGFNLEQFKQVSMIAQGEFLKLLHASTLERQKIFRDLFNTGIYEQFQNQLKYEEKKLSNEFKQLELIIQENLSLIGLSYEEDLSLKLGEILEKIKDNEYVLKEKNQLKEINDEILSNLKIKITQQQELFNKEKKIVNLKFEINVKEKELVALEDKNEKINQEYKNIDTISNQIAILNQELKYSKKKTLLNENLNQSLKNQVRLEKDLIKFSNNLEITKKLLNQKKQELDSLSDINQKILYVENELKAIDLKLENLNYLNNRITAYRKLENDFLILQQELKTSEANYQSLNQIFEKMDYLYKSSASAFLALDLKINNPCPVCGSLTHPKPCDLKCEQVTYQDYQKALKNSEEAYNQLKTLQLDVATLLNRLSLEKENIDKLIKENNIVNIKNIEKIYQEVFDKKINFKNKLKELEKSNHYKENLKQEIIDFDDKLKRDTDDLELIKTKIIKVNLDIENINQQLIEFKDIKDEISLNSEIKKLELYIQDLKKMYYESLNQLNNLKVDVKTKTNELIKLESEIKDLIELKSENLETKYTLLKDELNLLEKEIYQIKHQNTNYNNVYLKLQDKIILKQELFKKYTMVNNLMLLTTGSLSNNEKITLETFVQSSYFKEILNYSNVEFMRLSQGQYQFVPAEQNRGNGKFGLDLDILDNYNGNIRSVKSLSGGESFKAALAMALGFAYTIQNRSGGIAIECLFIDEGFGSLDEDSLNDAISTLSKLGENYLVGIISHVSELKNLIDKQIIIKKDKNINRNIKIIY